MKISAFDASKPVAPANDNASAAAQASNAAGKGAATPAAPEPSAKLALSVHAANASNASNESRADFDAEKVARIAQAIRDGQFSVNAGKIADGLIAQSREFITGRSH